MLQASHVPLLLSAIAFPVVRGWETPFARRVPNGHADRKSAVIRGIRLDSSDIRLQAVPAPAPLCAVDAQPDRSTNTDRMSSRRTACSRCDHSIAQQASGGLNVHPARLAPARISPDRFAGAGTFPDPPGAGQSRFNSRCSLWSTCGACDGRSASTRRTVVGLSSPETG